MIRRLIGETVELAWKPDPAAGRVRVDPAQLDQVLANLAVNARDAIRGVGRLTLETANVEVTAAYGQAHLDAAPGPYVMVAVTDAGSRMDRNTLSHLFEPFFTTKEQGKAPGSGLLPCMGSFASTTGPSQRAGAGNHVQGLPSASGRQRRRAGNRGRAAGAPGRTGDRAAGRGRGVHPGGCRGRPAAIGLPGAGGRLPSGGPSSRFRARRQHRPAGDRRGDAGHERQAACRGAAAHSPRPGVPLHIGIHVRCHRGARNPGGRCRPAAQAVPPRSAGRDYRPRGAVCGNGSFRIRHNRSTGAITQEALAPTTLSRCGVACGPQISSLRMMVTLVSITEA